MISQVSVLHGLHWVFFFWAKETKRVKQTKQFFTTKPTNSQEEDLNRSTAAATQRQMGTAGIVLATCLVYDSCYL